MSEISVSHFNTFPYGGAATASLRAHAQLLQQGVKSQYFWFRDERGGSHPPHVQQVELAQPKSSFFKSLFAKKKQRRIFKIVIRRWRRFRWRGCQNPVFFRLTPAT